jgi:RimJ/RimL family protein N-acetyltransferase
MSSAATHWPLFALEIRTPRLTLHYLDDDRAAALMDLAARGVHDPAEMPFSIPWTRHEPPYLQQQGMQHFWSMRAALSPEDWTVSFAVYEGERLVGTQSIVGKAFLVTRTFETGSWLGRSEQGKGIGKEMRAAVLHLGFAGLGAERAVTSAFADNPRSIGVTRALGYRENGSFIDDREGKPAEHLRFVMERADWEQRRRDDIEILGLEPCLRVLGIAPS